MNIKIARFLLVLPIVFLIIILSNCDSNLPCAKAVTVEWVYILFDLYDRTGTYNLLEIGVNEPGYRRDSVQLLNDKLEKFSGFRLDNGGRIIIDFLKGDNDFPLHEDLEKRYYLYISNHDLDTIDIYYRLGSGECTPVAVNHMDLYYNGQLVLENARQHPLGEIGYFKILKD